MARNVAGRERTGVRRLSALEASVRPPGGLNRHNRQGDAVAEVVLDGVGKVYPDGTRAVTDLNLDIADGEFLVLVGPSGCGKTTALRMVAGLEEISEGEIRIADRVINRVPSRDRDVAM